MAKVSLCITVDPATEVVAVEDRVNVVLPAPDTIVLLNGSPSGPAFAIVIPSPFLKSRAEAKASLLLPETILPVVVCADPDMP